MSVLVFGGLSECGRPFVEALHRRGTSIAVVDRATAGRADALPPDVIWHVGGMDDEVFMRRVFACHDVESIVLLPTALPLRETDLLIAMTSLLAAALRSRLGSLLVARPFANRAAMEACCGMGARCPLETLLAWCRQVHGIHCATLPFDQSLAATDPAYTARFRMIALDRYDEIHLTHLASLRKRSTTA